MSRTKTPSLCSAPMPGPPATRPYLLPGTSDKSDVSIRGTVAEVFAGKLNTLNRYRDQTLVELLEITSGLASDLDLKTILPRKVRLERKAPPGGKRGVERRSRQELIRVFSLEFGPLSARQMQEKLRTRGIYASHLTINEELNSLGFAPAQRCKGGRRSCAIAELTGQTVLPVSLQDE